MTESEANRAALAASNPLAALSREQLINEQSAAELLGISPQFLRCSRMKRPRWDGPEFVTVGNGAIRYRVGALLDYIAEHTVKPADRLRKAS